MLAGGKKPHAALYKYANLKYERNFSFTSSYLFLNPQKE